MRAACRASDHRDASRAGEGEDGGGGVGQEPRDRVRRADDEGGDEGVGERRQLGRRRVHVEHERRRSREGLAVELAYVKQATAPPTDGDGSTAGSREQSSLVWMLGSV